MSARRFKWKGPGGQVKERWQVDFVFKHSDGRAQRVTSFSPVNTRRGAEQYERDVRSQLQAGTYKKEEQRVMTLGEFVPRYLTYSANNNKISSVHVKKQILTDHILPFFGAMRLDEVKLAAIEEFKALMRTKPSAARGRKEDASRAAVNKRYGTEPKALSLKSVNNVLAILRKLLSLAYEQEVIQHMPTVKLFKVAKSGFQFLDFDEADRLIKHADAEWRPFLLTALRTGARLGELIGLQWTDVDLVRGTITINRTVWRGKLGTPKGGRSRTIDLSPSVVSALGALERRGIWVFGSGNKPLTPGLCKWPLKRALTKAGISRPEGRIGYHDLRHSFASHLVMMGQPLKAVQELLGHASITMTERYAHLSPDVRRSAVASLDRRVSPPTPQYTVNETGLAAKSMFLQ